MERIVDLVHTSLVACCMTLDISHNFSVLAINQHLSKPLSSFSSEGVGCGSSSSWANDSKGQCEPEVGVAHTPQSNRVRVSSPQSLIYLKTRRGPQSSFQRNQTCHLKIFQSNNTQNKLTSTANICGESPCANH